VPSTLSTDQPLAVAAVAAIRTGDLDALRRLLADNPGLATARLGDDREARTLLHVLTDWPGHFPAGAATVAALVDAGADVNARFVGPHTETPLHWAASRGDVNVLDALVDAGADGAVIAGGTADLTGPDALGETDESTNWTPRARRSRGAGRRSCRRSHRAAATCSRRPLRDGGRSQVDP
jgi:hypothetical protein